MLDSQLGVLDTMISNHGSGYLATPMITYHRTEYHRR
jgi:hypothetical protein